MNLASFLNIMQMLIMLLIVIFIANVSLKFVNKNMLKNNKIIKVVEKVALNNTSSLAVVEICGSYYLMSFTGQDNKILKELDKNQIEEIINHREENKELGFNTNTLKDILGMRDKN